jgi:hypothetical protein
MENTISNNTLAGGYVPVTVQNATVQAGDNHVFSINMDTSTLYETYDLQSNAVPWMVDNGVNWDLTQCWNKTNSRWLWYGNDSDGVTSADVSGMPTYPLVLTYGEMFSGGPIQHVIRIGVPCQSGGHYNGIVWPAGHGPNDSSLVGAPPVGTRLVLNPSFDTVTCHFKDCAGLAYPNWFRTLLVVMQNYGIIVSDCGGGYVSIISDSVSGWGATDDYGVISGTTTTCGGASQEWGSCTIQMQGFFHGIHWSDFQVIEPSAHVVNINSHQVK